MDPLNDRLKKIEERLAAIESALRTQPSRLVFDSASTLPPRASNMPPPAPLQNSSFSRSSNHNQTPATSPLFMWFKSNWLVSVGIFLILLALGWFVSLAFANHWIGEKARVWLTLISAASIYVVGLWRLKKNLSQSQILLVLGEAIAIVALFAGHQYYGFFPPIPTFFSMLAIVSATAIIAIIYNLSGLGLTSVIFAAQIPVLIQADNSDSIFLMLYVLMIDVAALWMWLARGWGKVFHIAWLATIFYSFSFVTLYGLLIPHVLLWSFFLIFFLTVALPIFQNKLSSLPLKGTFILAGLPLAFIFWTHYLTPFPWNVISYSIASLLWMTVGYFLTKGWNQIEPQHLAYKYFISIVVGISAMFFMFNATSHLITHFFSQPTIAELNALLFFLEITGVILASYCLLQRSPICIFLSLFFIIPLIFVWHHSENLLYASLLNLNFLLLSTGLFSLFLTAMINQKASSRTGLYPSHQLILTSLWILVGVFFMMLIWNLCHQIISTPSIARGTALVLFVVSAEILIYLGNLKQLKPLRLAGGAIILFVLALLLGYEIWKMPIGIRILTFIIIGFLLIGTAFFDKQHHHKSS